MTTTPEDPGQPLEDGDLETVVGGSVSRPGGTDGTDGDSGDADGTDGDSGDADGTDGDNGDADGTDR